jgi:lipopolysaccharide transport system permease protein
MRIRRTTSWFHVPWREISAYRDLLFFLVRRDLIAIYKQSILGPVWFVLQPLATTLIFTVIFGRVARIGTDGLPPFLFYMSGTVLWHYFAGCLNGVSGSLMTNAPLLRKVYVPRLIIPFSLVISSLAQFVLNMGTFAAFYVYFYFFTEATLSPSWWILLVPLAVLQCAVTGLGSGLWLSALTVKYRDLRFALPFLSQLWMYLTPVIFPASKFAGKWRMLLAINPMACAIEFNRFAFLGRGEVGLPFVLTGLSTGILLLLSGLVVFTRAQRTFADTI